MVMGRAICILSYNRMIRIIPMNLQIRICRRFITNTFVLKTKEDLNAFLENDWESPRIKQFHQKLKLQPIPKLGPRDRFIDLMLVETDSKTGQLIINSKTEPTKWGDWQTGGRVSDF